MHQLIVSPQNDKYVVVRPGARNGMQIPHGMYEEVANAVKEGASLPSWLTEAAQKAWGLRPEITSAAGSVLVRPITSLNYNRASWEINKGCNFNCEHCYLAERKFAGLPRGEKTNSLPCCVTRVFCGSKSRAESPPSIAISSTPTKRRTARE